MYNNYAQSSWTDPDYWMGMQGMYAGAGKSLRMVAADLQIRNVIRVTNWKDKQESEYYNDLTYKAKRFIELIEDVKDPVLQYHFYRAVLGDRYMDLEAAIYQVQEEEEKGKVDALIKKFGHLESNLAPYAKAYQSSPFPEMYRLMEDFDKQKKALPPQVSGIFYSSLKPRPVATSGALTAVVVGILFLLISISGLFITLALIDPKKEGAIPAAVIFGFSLFLFLLVLVLFLRWQKRQKTEDRMYWQAKAEYDSKLPALREVRKAAEEKLTRHPLFAHMETLNQQFEQYAYCIEKLEVLEVSFKKKWGSGSMPQFISPASFGL